MWPFSRFLDSWRTSIPMIPWLVSGLKSGLWSPKHSFVRKDPPSQLLLVELSVKVSPCFFIVVVLHSKFNELCKLRHVYLNGFCGNVTLAFWHLFAFPYRLNRKEVLFSCWTCRITFQIFLLLVELGESSCLYLLCHLFIQLIIHLSIIIRHLGFIRPWG